MNDYITPMHILNINFRKFKGSLSKPSHKLFEIGRSKLLTYPQSLSLVDFMMSIDDISPYAIPTLIPSLSQKILDDWIILHEVRRL
jgi:hypothetical protein